MSGYAIYSPTQNHRDTCGDIGASFAIVTLIGVALAFIFAV